MDVRDAERGDYRAILKCLEEMGTDNAQFSISWLKVTKTVASMIDDPDAWIFLAIDDGAIAGMFAVERTNPWYSEDYVLEEAWIFVRKPYRKTRAIFKLLKEVQNLSCLLGNMPVSVNVVTPHRPDAKVKLFKRYFNLIGYRHVQKEIQTGN